MGYELASKSFLRKTVHAGEAHGPASIYQAITDLHAERIGHGIHVFDDSMVTHVEGEEARKEYVNKNAEYLADSRTCFEVCLTSNLQTLPALENDLTRHPMKEMIKRKLAVTLNTDNPLVSSTNMVKEIRLACDSFKLSPRELKNIILNGFKHSFMPIPYVEKRKYIRQIIDEYEKIEKEFDICT